MVDIHVSPSMILGTRVLFGNGSGEGHKTRMIEDDITNITHGKSTGRGDQKYEELLT